MGVTKSWTQFSNWTTTIWSLHITVCKVFSYCGQYWNQTDYILCSQRWRSSIQSAKTRPGADCGSGCELLIAKSIGLQSRTRLSDWSDLISSGLIFGCKEYSQSDFSVDQLVMSMCRVFSCVVGRGCLLWPVCSLGETLLALALLNSVLQGQICLLLQVFLDFILLHSSPL